MANPSQQLLQAGQSVWLDYIDRPLLTSGRLARLIEEGIITGMTSNPTIFDKAISGSDAYDAQLREVVESGVSSGYEAFVPLAIRDIAAAADELQSVYNRSRRADGYVSLEVPPGIEHDRDATVAEAQRLFALVDRPNAMIKVPGTPAGIEALAELIAAGVNVNVTLLFSSAVYERVARAYIAGLEQRKANGDSLDTVASVASFFVSRVDTAVDRQLPEGHRLRGKVAVANARDAYGRFLGIFDGPAWESLAAEGARVQRPLWASTGTKNAEYSDILYVEELIAADTVNTMPEKTLEAALDHLNVRPTIEPNLGHAAKTLNGVAAAGIDLDAITGQLLVEGLAAFERDFLSLMTKLEKRLVPA